MSYIKAIPSVLSKTANYTVSTNDGDNVQVNVDATSGAATITFYAASGNTGKIITVKKTDSSANAVTLDGNASETLDGATTLTLSAQYDSATLVCNGTNWIKASAIGAGAIAVSGMAANDDIYASSATQLKAGARQLRQTFRGLTLRTHPDADVAASKVWLDHADEIVMHDGTRVADWDDLAADITASGAGGLDTGSEGASRWYEIHAIRKSSDGTKGLLLHRAKSYDLDQSQTTGRDFDAGLNTTSSVEKRAQTFTPTITGVMPFVDLNIIKVLAPTGYLTVALYATSGGVPTGAALATADKLDVSLVSTSAQWVRFVFRTPATLTASTVYAIVASVSYATGNTNYIAWCSDSTSPAYAGGSIANYNGTTWSADATVDTLFRAYVTQNDTAVTMPSGYDQRCLVGYVYNNSSSNFRKFRQQDRFVYPADIVETLIVSAGTATVATLVDASAFYPPVPVTATGFLVNISTVGAYVQVGTDVFKTAYNYEWGFYFTGYSATAYLDVSSNIPVEAQELYYSVTGGGNTSLHTRSWRF